MTTPTLKVLLYSHDGMGLGHMRRNQTLAQAIVEADPRACLIMASSGDSMAGFDLPPRTDMVRLPGIRKITNDRYVAKHLAISAHEVHAVRAGILTSLVDSFDPHVIVVDKHVLGAKGEMSAALERARSRGIAAVLGLRDILDEPAVVRADWERIGAARVIERFYERVLIYGAPEIADPVDDYGLPCHLADRVRFCGYVTNSPKEHPTPRPLGQLPTVLACAGGGEDGLALLGTFLESTVGQPWKSVMVTGPGASKGAAARLCRRAQRLGVEHHEFLPDLQQRIGKVDALVSMGGYNTLVEAVVRGTPTVCVPRTEPRTEQLIRATAFKAAGLIELIEPGQLCPSSMREHVNAAIGKNRGALRALAHEMFAFDGAARGAAEILAVARRTEAVRELGGVRRARRQTIAAESF